MSTVCTMPLWANHWLTQKQVATREKSCGHHSPPCNWITLPLPHSLLFWTRERQVGLSNFRKEMVDYKLWMWEKTHWFERCWRCTSWPQEMVIKIVKPHIFSNKNVNISRRQGNESLHILPNSCGVWKLGAGFIHGLWGEVGHCEVRSMSSPDMMDLHGCDGVCWDLVATLYRGCGASVMFVLAFAWSWFW